ncbi:MAG: acyl carrier protein [Deltaproteobacteria bacterium]|nr:acyl carrier protein [Deltaproteobacteria bacterium]
MEKFLNELKVKIIETLNLTDITPEDFNEEDPLVGGDLGIDSIDVLEMVMLIEKEYGVSINNKELGAKVFSTLKNLAEYIHEKSPEFAG